MIKIRKHKKIDREKTKGFTMIEIMVVVGVLAALFSLIFVFFGGATKKARDTKRINDISQVGKFLAFGCPVPDAGFGEYDMIDLLNEFANKYPKYKGSLPQNVSDPKHVNDPKSHYMYIVTATNKCVLYANLEEADTKITLPDLSAVTPAGGKGVLESTVTGINGTKKYFQYSN